MGFGPDLGQTGMTPNDWSETEARREERATRADHPHGREISARSRRIATVVLTVAAVALMAYAVLGMAGAIDVPGITG